MKPFGTPVRQLDIDDYDPEHCAAWMLELIDESPDKLAILKMPPHDRRGRPRPPPRAVQRCVRDREG